MVITKFIYDLLIAILSENPSEVRNIDDFSSKVGEMLLYHLHFMSFHFRVQVSP